MHSSSLSPRHCAAPAAGSHGRADRRHRPRRQVGREPWPVRRRRTLGLPRFAVDALSAHHARQSAEELAAKDWLAGPDGDFVFTTKVGTPLNPDDLRDYVYMVLDRVGLKGRITLYGMRHTAASLLYSQTRDFKLVAGFLGHSSVSMAQKTYVHLLGGDDHRAADALDRALGG